MLAINDASVYTSVMTSVPSFEFGPARAGDGEPICHVIAETWVDTYPNAEYGITEAMIRGNQYTPAGQLRPDFIELTEASVRNNGHGANIQVARFEETVVAVGAIKFLEDARRKLTVLFVLPDFQGNRIGPRILDPLLEAEQSHEVFLKVATYNKRAIDLYVSRGFEVVGPATDDHTVFNNGVILPEFEMIRPASS
jgi:ribosomal protein S18 acetylase RimI-like enzyme